MSNPLNQREEFFANPDSKQHIFRSSKRSLALRDVTNFSPHENVVVCKRYKNDNNKSSEISNSPDCNSFGEANGLCGGNKPYRSWGSHAKNYSGSKNEERREEPLGPWRDVVDSIISKPHVSEENQTFAETREFSSSSLVEQQINVSNNSHHNSIENKTRLSNGLEGCQNIFAGHDEQLLFGPNGLPPTSRVASTSVFFPDSVIHGGPAVSLASKANSASHESCNQRHKQNVATNLTSYLGSSNINIVKNTADFGRIIMGDVHVVQDSSSGSKLMNSATSASKLPELSSEKNSDIAPNCSCYFCRKAAFIWSDVNYHDIEGRILALRQSMAHAASLIKGDCFSGIPESSHNHDAFGKFNPEADSQPLEFHLMHHWRSLFIQTQKALSSENIQLQSTLHKAKELQEKCKTDLEVIHNVGSKDL